MTDPVVPPPVPAPLQPEGEPREPARHSAVWALVHALEGADPGTLAALRRIRTDALPPAFFRVAATTLDEHLPESGPSRERLETRWAVVVQAMAMASESRLLGRVPLGKALAEAGVAEMRVLRLLEAHDELLADVVRTVVHQLVSKARTFSPTDLADLVLDDGSEHAERARRRIARFFYSTATKAPDRRLP
ncbi:MAG: type I-E CRISPR-associated protein Cse2/CasB [Deltaproteobacteria bacterium]|nr:type I-E CRISPR-associated protein Cse2/CasB [Deltaproteobacteria bacterium]